MIIDKINCMSFGRETEGLRADSRGVGAPKYLAILADLGWAVADAGEYVTYFLRSIEAREHPEAGLSADEQAEALDIEKRNGVLPDFAIFRNPAQSPR